MIRPLVAAHCLGLISLSLATAARSEAAATEPGSPALVSGIDARYIDRNVRPQDDFYRFVNGKWLDSTPIPADKASVGSFDIRYEESLEQLRDLIETAARDTSAPEGSDTRRIGDLYRSFLDEARLETLGAAPLKDELARIAALRDKRGIADLVAHLQQIGIVVPLAQNVHLDNKDSTRYVFDVSQDGLGMPDRDYYLKDDAELKKIRTEYRAHIQRTLSLLGDKAAADEARDILALETALARVQWTKVENRDPLKVYNRIEIARLRALAPNFDWKRYLVATGVDGKVDYLIVSQPTYLRAFGRILDTTSLAVWKNYLRWRLLSGYSPYLSSQYVDEDFGFSYTALQGVPQNRPRWKRGITLVDQSIGEALGSLYVRKYFPKESKARADALVRNLLDAFGRDLEDLDWMGPQTRQQAKTKLAHIATKIGYPDRWRDYSQLELKADDLVGNVMRARQFEFRRNVAKLGKPVDRTEWGMSPQTVNAYYDPEMNEIVFPAGILQPPFFNSAADDAVNYGAIGAVIGHEISHGFDDQGSLYDEKGNLRTWWTDQDRKAFEAKTRALIAQYGAYEPVRGYHVNGELTLGENIADNSGVAIAFKAYQLSLAGGAAPVLDGFTGEQRFYMGWAQAWREKDRDNFLIELIKSDPHSPSTYRARAVVNQPAFYQAFAVKQGDGMYVPPGQRVIMW
ncbi:MAG TPA: M13 family metallopeptidase [Burkholderiaceae bacterium]|jgi:predicted metalloendopeptidase|nr:M13 family metallopeptidase [Burkholderiaceae bacterium]